MIAAWLILHCGGQAGLRNVVALSALRAQVTYNIGFAPGLAAASGAD
ncbi:hypothetical protein [Burkholderia ubonensis]|nr:hypothetical protein [Burkholderia ubonensis]